MKKQVVLSPMHHRIVTRMLERAMVENDVDSEQYLFLEDLRSQVRKSPSISPEVVDAIMPMIEGWLDKHMCFNRDGYLAFEELQDAICQQTDQDDVDRKIEELCT